MAFLFASVPAFADLKKIKEERILYLINAMEFGNEEAEDELKRVAPEEYEKVKRDFATGAVKLHRFPAPAKSKVMRWPAANTAENRRKVKRDIQMLKASDPKRFENFILEPLGEDEFPSFSFP